MKRIISIVLLACMLCGLMAGCKAKKSANSATDIEIIYWETGYGRAWLDAIIAEFNGSQDLYKATLVSSAENRLSEINRGDATGDLYIGSGNTLNSWAVEYLHPLDGLLDLKLDGEDGLTLREKFGGFAENNTHPNGKVYALPSSMFGGINGIFYNADMMVDADGNPYKLPNTTDELVKLCLSLTSDGQIPFIHYADYWYYVYEAWMMQYEGIQAMYDLWNGTYVDENGVRYENDVRCITESQGRYEAYKVLEDLLAPKGYTYTNTNSFNHTTGQTYFLAKKAVMTPNGSWIENEMGGGDAAKNVKVMKQPVLSAVADKLGIRSDKHLSLIVDFVDGTPLTDAQMEVVNSYSAEVIEAVREDRNIYYGSHPDHVVIPNYSNCIDGAEAFLKFMWSDEGMAIASSIVGAPSGLKYSNEANIDSSNWSPFMQEVAAIRKTATVVSAYINAPIYYMSGVDHIQINHPVRSMTYRTDGGIMNADQYWAKEVAAWETQWESMKRDAGLQ